MRAIGAGLLLTLALIAPGCVAEVGPGLDVYAAPPPVYIGPSYCGPYAYGPYWGPTIGFYGPIYRGGRGHYHGGYRGGHHHR